MPYVICTLYSFFLIYFWQGQYRTNISSKVFSKKAFKFILICPVLYWLLLLGGQYFVGTDYPAYYKYFDGFNVEMYAKRHEYSLVLFCSLIKKLNLPPQTGFFIYSFVDILFFCLFLSKFNFKRLDLFFLIYFCCATAFINQQNTLRQYAAMNIFLLGFYYCYKKSFIKYVLCILLAACFHMSAILLIVIYPLRILFSINSKKLLYLELMAGVLFCFVGIDSLITWFVKFTPYSFYLQSAYFLDGNRKSLLNIVTKLIYLPFFIRSFNYIKLFNTKEIFLLNSGVFFYSVKLISMSSFFLSRFSMYFDVLSYLPLYLNFVYFVKKRGKYKYSQFCELVIFLCVVIGPYFFKTVVAPSNEYLYQSIYFR